MAVALTRSTASEWIRGVAIGTRSAELTVAACSVVLTLVAHTDSLDESSKSCKLAMFDKLNGLMVEWLND